jgi:serine/threonine protein kinase
MAQSSAGSPPPEKDPAIKATPGESSFAESRNPDETFELASPSGADSLSSGCFEHAPGEPGVPKAFGRYEVVKVLGSGGFGTVYLGHDRQLDRPVAIKSHRADRAISQEILNEFLHEARRLAKLRHPGIVAVHDFGADGGHVFIISDYVEGITLSDRLESQPITWQESVRIIAALADALAHAHALRIVHRDIKPANIILTPDGKPVLVDFGLGLDDSELDGGKRGLIAGTPAYMSPEQASGRGHRIDGRTDIYALGVVLYELLTGRVPFCAAIISELLRQVREDDPQPPRQLVPQVPRALESIPERRRPRQARCCRRERQNAGQPAPARSRTTAGHHVGLRLRSVRIGGIH